MKPDSLKLFLKYKLFSLSYLVRTSPERLAVYILRLAGWNILPTDKMILGVASGLDVIDMRIKYDMDEHIARVLSDRDTKDVELKGIIRCCLKSREV